MAKFFIYRSDLGTATARPIVRWGDVPAANIPAQAIDPGEVAVASEVFVPVIAGQGGVAADAVVTNYYDPTTGGFAVGVALADASVTAAAVRRRRTGLLGACDWTQLADVVLAWAAATDNATATARRDSWRVYRQALRDVPQQTGFPSSVTWPTPPAA